MITSFSPSRALLASILALGGLFGAASLSAQTVTTAPVGAVSKVVPVGLSTIGFTLLNPDLAVANCTVSTPTVLTLGGLSNVGSLLTTGIPFYVEAINGALEGERFEVDVAATIASNNSTVTLVAGSSTNTAILASGEAVGSQFAIRRHITLSQVQSMFTTPLTAGTSTGNADQIRIYVPSTRTFNVYFLRAEGWHLGTTQSDNVAIPPGVGIFFQKRGTSATLVATGGVRLNDFSMPMDIGLSLRSVGYPVDFSPVMLGATLAQGWTGGTSSGNSDQLRIYNPTTRTFAVNFLRNTDGWFLGTNEVTTSALISADSAYMLQRRSADSDYILASPLTGL